MIITAANHTSVSNTLEESAFSAAPVKAWQQAKAGSWVRIQGSMWVSDGVHQIDSIDETVLDGHEFKGHIIHSYYVEADAIEEIVSAPTPASLAKVGD